MKEGNVLIIVVGGNISQLLPHHEGHQQKLTGATVGQIQDQLLGAGGNTIELLESTSSRAKQIRIKVEGLDEDEATGNIEQRDSAQVNPAVWAELVKKIQRRIPDYEGMVVLHGLDTLSYTASAVSFMVRNLNIPIVFTGSQRQLNYLRSDARQNIYTAVTIAAGKSLGSKPINEVTIYLHDTLYRANRATMSSATSYQSFNSLNYPPLASVGEHIDVQEHLILRRSATGSPVFYAKSDANVHILDVFPGMAPRRIAAIVEKDFDRNYVDSLKQIAKSEVDDGQAFIDTEEWKVLAAIEDVLDEQSQAERLAGLLSVDLQGSAREVLRRLDSELPKDDVRGVILRTYGMGTAPTSVEVLKALKRVVDSGIIVMNVTQAHSHRVSFNSDPVSLRLYEQGVISGLDMTSESAFAKMVVVLSQPTAVEKGLDHLEDLLQTNIAGEQSHTVVNYHFQPGETSDPESNDEDLHSSRLHLKSASKDFDLRDKEVRRIDNIQLRILGLRKSAKGGISTRIKIAKYDDESQDNPPEEIILDVYEPLENPREEELKTVNISYDITELKEALFSKHAVFRVFSDQGIVWSRISIVIFSNDRT